MREAKPALFGAYANVPLLHTNVLQLGKYALGQIFKLYLNQRSKKYIVV